MRSIHPVAAWCLSAKGEAAEEKQGGEEIKEFFRLGKGLHNASLIQKLCPSSRLKKNSIAAQHNSKTLPSETESRTALHSVKKKSCGNLAGVDSFFPVMLKW